MKRKVVKQGAATLMVSLPSKWAKKYNLKKGDEINIEELDNNLVLSKESVSGKRRTSINLTNHTESAIRTAITNTYRAGYDLVTVQFGTEHQYRALLNTMRNNLLGFEVIKKENTLCVVENITEPSELQFEVLMRKIFYNISLFIESTEKRLRGETKFEDYEELELKIQQYDNFCRRVISKKNLFGNKATFFWTFIALLIHGQRELYHLNRFLDSNKLIVKNLAVFEKLKRAYELLSDAYAQKEVAKLEQLHTLEKEALYGDFYKFVQKGNKEVVLAHHIATATRNFYLASSPLIGLLLESHEFN